MKKTMRTFSSSPPVHVHINESTPVHVHVKSTQRPSPIRSPQGKTKKDPKGNLHPAAKAKTRVPWIPPGKSCTRDSTRDSTYKWEGPSHRLEIPPLPEPEPSHSTGLRLADLSSEEEEVLHGSYCISQYEQKIDSLMTEVGSLKSEVELRKKKHELSVSQRVIAEQEEELAEVAKELEVTESENSRLRRSMELIMGEGARRLDRVPDAHQDRDALLQKLLEAEGDGNAAAQQVSALRESVAELGGCSSSKGRRLSGSESTMLARQKDLLLQKLGTFEATNHTLRQLLRDQHGSQLESMRLAEKKDSLLKRLTDAEAENAHLVIKLQEKEKELDQLSILLDTEKDNAKTKALESTRAHLQGQLRSKEAENNRLAVQIKKLERAANQQKGEMEHLTDQLATLRQQAGVDREALKRATRAQKHRAERSEDTTEQLSSQLFDMERQVSDALSAAENWRTCHGQEVKEKGQMQIELAVLNSRVKELSEQLQTTEDKGRMERETLLGHLQGLTSDGTAAKLENQSLKAMLSAVEEKLSVAQMDAQQVKSTVKKYEGLLDGYKTQVAKTRAEADEYCVRLGRAEREALGVRQELEREVDQVRRELLSRLTELEPLPDALRRSELLLQETHDREHTQGRQSLELGSALADLRRKVETQGSQVELLRQKNTLLLEENKRLQHGLEHLERKLEETSSQNGDLLAVIAKREETIQSNQSRLEDKSRECSLLTRRLEEALEDARQQVSETREHAATKERSTKSKMVDLETQLSRTTTEINQLRRSKQEVERRYQSRLQDVKDRLEQSDSTNRSLQNYVQFLKASYANVFGESALTSTRSQSPQRRPSP
ncbi:unnamed protein product [Boreogadus saida]